MRIRASFEVLSLGLGMLSFGFPGSGRLLAQLAEGFLKLFPQPLVMQDTET